MKITINPDEALREIEVVINCSREDLSSISL